MERKPLVEESPTPNLYVRTAVDDAPPVPCSPPDVPLASPPSCKTVGPVLGPRAAAACPEASTAASVVEAMAPPKEPEPVAVETASSVSLPAAVEETEVSGVGPGVGVADVPGAPEPPAERAVPAETDPSSSGATSTAGAISAGGDPTDRVITAVLDSVDARAEAPPAEASARTGGATGVDAGTITGGGSMGGALGIAGVPIGTGPTPLMESTAERAMAWLDATLWEPGWHCKRTASAFTKALRPGSAWSPVHRQASKSGQGGRPPPDSLEQQLPSVASGASGGGMSEVEARHGGVSLANL